MKFQKSFSWGRNLRMFVIKHFLYTDTLYSIVYLIPPKREHPTFNLIAPTHMLSVAMIASRPAILTSLLQHSCCSSPAPRSHTHHSNMWFVKRACVYSATHCAALLSPSLISLPALPLPFQWSPRTCYGMAPQAWWQKSGGVGWWRVCGCGGATLSVHSIFHISALPLGTKTYSVLEFILYLLFFMSIQPSTDSGSALHAHISCLHGYFITDCNWKWQIIWVPLCNVDYIIKPRSLSYQLPSHYFVGLIEQHNDYLCFWSNISFTPYLI